MQDQPGRGRFGALPSIGVATGIRLGRSRTRLEVVLNPFRKGSDKAEAVGFGFIALVAVLFGVATGSLFAWAVALIAAVRSLLLVRSLRPRAVPEGNDCPGA